MSDETNVAEEDAFAIAAQYAVVNPAVMIGLLTAMQETISELEERCDALEDHQRWSEWLEGVDR